MFWLAHGRETGADSHPDAEEIYYVISGAGRLVIRPSGTEPVIRVMAEGDDAEQVKSIVDRICNAVQAVAA